MGLSVGRGLGRHRNLDPDQAWEAKEEAQTTEQSWAMPLEDLGAIFSQAGDL